MRRGGTMLGVICASDKTPLTMGTGNREMHPVLLSLANIEPGVCMKATYHSFVLAAYLPIPKFINVSVPVQVALAAHVYHSCLTIVTENLQWAAWEGVKIPDSLGHIHVCYPTLIPWIANLPEQRLIAGILQNQSPILEATLDHFRDGPGDQNWPCCDHNRTLQHIHTAVIQTDPSDIPAFVKMWQPLGLLSVHQLFWQDWGMPLEDTNALMACPSYFLMLDALYQWHKFFDHPLKWASTS